MMTGLNGQGIYMILGGKLDTFTFELDLFVPNSREIFETNATDFLFFSKPKQPITASFLNTKTYKRP